MERPLAKVFGVLFVVTLVTGMILVNTKANADTSANASVNVSDACTLSGGDHSYSITLNPGQENSSIGPSNIKAACNDYNGYSIYAIGYSGNSYTGNNTKLLGTIANNNISTNTSGNDSYWAMKVNAVSGTYTPTITNDFDNSNFHVIPASYTQIAKLTSATDAGSNPTGSNISTYYKVKISTTQTADTYTGKVKYTLVHPNTMVAGTYTITYDANGGSGTMDNQTAYNVDNTTLNAFSSGNITAPEGYAFAGWCTVQDQTASGILQGADPQTTCTGISYTDESTVPPLVVSANGTLNLYAYWGPMTFDQAFATAGKTKYDKYYKIQDMSSSICSAIGTEQTGQLIDIRDNQVYNVGKLVDDRCWMLDNLALDLTNDNILNNMNETNTNASNNTLGYLKGITTGSASDQYATAKVANWTSSYSYSDPLVNLTNKDVVPTSYNGTDDPMKDQVIAGNWKVGGYYNYCAASAGSYCYGNGTSYGRSQSSATESICPKGWRIPVSTNDFTWDEGEYDALANQFGFTQTTNNATAVTNYRSALHLPFSGYFESGSAYRQGSYNITWSSSFWSNSEEDDTLTLYVNAGLVDTGSTEDRFYGDTLRCIAE